MIFSVMRFASRGFSSKYSASRSLTTCSTHVFTCDETSLSFVCDENFGSRILIGDDGRETFADVVAFERELELLEHARVDDVLVDRARERALEADQVRAAVGVLDRVRERVDVVGVAVVPLQRDLDLLAVLLVADEDRLSCSGVLFLFRSLDERDDAALVAELVVLLAALVA